MPNATLSIQLVPPPGGLTPATLAGPPRPPMPPAFTPPPPLPPAPRGPAQQPPAPAATQPAPASQQGPATGQPPGQGQPPPFSALAALMGKPQPPAPAPQPQQQGQQPPQSPAPQQQGQGQQPPQPPAPQPQQGPALDPLAAIMSTLDAEFQARRAKAEELDKQRRERALALEEEKADLERRRLDPLYRAREAMEQEQAAKRRRDEEDKARRQIDPEYRKKAESGDRDEKNKKRQEFGETIAKPFRALEGPARAIGAMDPAAALGPMIGVATAALGPFGAAVGAAANVVTSFAGGLTQTVEKMGQYNPEVAVAKAQAEARSIINDIQRGQKLGPDLASFVQAKSDLKEQGKDLLAKIAPPFIKIATWVMKRLGEFIDWIMNDVPNFFIDALNSIITLLNGIIEVITLGNSKDTIGLLSKLVKNTEKEQAGAADNLFMKQLRNQIIPEGRRMGADGPVDSRLRMPLFEGF